MFHMLISKLRELMIPEPVQIQKSFYTRPKGWIRSEFTILNERGCLREFPNL